MGYSAPIPCMDCGVDTFTLREWYHVHNEVWEQVASINGGTFLCIGCLEARLGRTLVPADFDGYEPHPLDTDRLRERKNGVTRFVAPFVVVKVHAQGLQWWEEQGMPETMTIGCRTLEQREGWRPYAQPRGGKHFIYEAAPGLSWPTVEYDTFIDTMHYWTRLPPSPTKWWVNFRDPALIDRFPDPSPLRELALDLGPMKKAAK